jgi:hypothetical protein
VHHHHHHHPHHHHPHPKWDWTNNINRIYTCGTYFKHVQTSKNWQHFTGETKPYETIIHVLLPVKLGAIPSIAKQLNFVPAGGHGSARPQPKAPSSCHTSGLR